MILLTGSWTFWSLTAAAAVPTFDHLRSFCRVFHHLYGGAAPIMAERGADHVAAVTAPAANKTYPAPNNPPPGEKSALSIRPVLDPMIHLLKPGASQLPEVPIYDSSYLTNEALWDSCFFSGAAPCLQPANNGKPSSAWDQHIANIQQSLQETVTDFVASPQDNPLSSCLDKRDRMAVTIPTRKTK